LSFQSNYFKERDNVVEVASVPVFVDGNDISGLAVTTRPGGTASGRIVLEGSSKPDASKAVNINVVPVGGPSRVPNQSNLTISADGSFQLRGLGGAVLFRPVAMTAGWMLKAVRAQGRDITDVPVDFQNGGDVSGMEIVLTDKLTSVAGTAHDGSGQPVKDYAV